MSKHLFKHLFFTFVIGISVALCGCEDKEDTDDEELIPPVMGTNGTTSIKSKKEPKFGQKNRSSDNFNLSNKYSRYEVSCSEGIKFEIMVDISSASDDVIYSGLKNGSIIKKPVGTNHNNFYIANPSGAKNDFTVKFVPAAPVLWMAGLDGDKYLYEFSIPGTHDSGTGTSDVEGGYYKCQNSDINLQLQDGIRFFDIRLGSEDTPKLYHGGKSCGINFEDVLKLFNDFLSVYTGETILMTIKEEHGKEMTTKLKNYFKNNPNMVSRVYRGTKIPKLKDVRGKIVLFRRFDKPNSEDWGINVHDGWPDNTSRQWVNEDGAEFYVQDRFFSQSETHDTGKKKNLLNETMGKSIQGDPIMFFSFSSVSCNVGAARTPWMYAWGKDNLISPIVNHVLSDLLNSYTKIRPACLGVIVMDFYSRHGYDDNKRLVEKIINSNFTTDKI